MKHKHHIVPRHAGGLDDSTNLVELTPIQHAMWHYAEWQLHGRWQDRIAWRGLCGLIDTSEAREQAIREGSRNAHAARVAKDPNWHSKLIEAALEKQRWLRENDKDWRDAERARLTKLGKEHGHKGGKASLGKRWWHNESTGQTTRSEVQPGPQWRLGKAPLKEESKLKQSRAQSGMLFWNNGRISIRAKDCPGDEWVRGRLPRKSDSLSEHLR